MLATVGFVAEQFFQFPGFEASEAQRRKRERAAQGDAARDAGRDVHGKNPGGCLGGSQPSGSLAF